jgi:hypothetical protein
MNQAWRTLRAAALVTITVSLISAGCGQQASSGSASQAKPGSDVSVGHPTDKTKPRSNTKTTPQNPAVPDVRGMTYQRASNRLARSGFTRVDGIARHTCDQSKDGIVTAQNPRAGTHIPASTRIRLTADAYEADVCGSSGGLVEIEAPEIWATGGGSVYDECNATTCWATPAPGLTLIIHPGQWQPAATVGGIQFMRCSAQQYSSCTPISENTPDRYGVSAADSGYYFAAWVTMISTSGSASRQVVTRFTGRTS